MMDISIIIPTNQPSPQSVNRLREGGDWNGDVEIIICSGGTASTARNAGIEAASHDKLLFLDDDSLPSDDYLRRVSVALDEYPAVRGRVLHYGTEYGPPSDWYDLGDETKSCEVLIGCNMAVRKEVIDTVGKFDPTLPYGHEETEWSERIAEEYQIYYIPSMVVKHQYASSLIDLFEKRYRHGREYVTFRHSVQEATLSIVLRQGIHLPTLAESVSSFAGELVKYVGLIHGVLRATRNSDTSTSEGGISEVDIRVFDL